MDCINISASFKIYLTRCCAANSLWDGHH